MAESPFAQELADRIQKATRRRRVTVPPGTGPDSTDPNVVASYLDNQLPPDQVTEYEERCLKSDVYLAEVASCHQVLSMIGQKAKVPAEVKYRIYRLVKGKEAIARDLGRSAPPSEPVAAPIPAWTLPPPPARSPLERYGPVLAVAGLMGLMV